MAITAGLGNDLAIRAALLYLLAHAVFKAGLFLGIGAIDHAAGTRKLSELGGLRHRTPLLCGVVAVLAGSMAGLPPFAGFLSKELVLKKLLLADTSLHDVAVLGIVLGSIGTAAYTARFLFDCFWGQARSDGAASARPPGFAFLFAPGLLAALSLAGGLGAPYTDRWIVEPMTKALLGYSLDVPELRLWHGVNVPLVMSGLILTLGGLFYWVSERRHLPGLFGTFDGPHCFEAFLEHAQRLGGGCNRALAGASPSLYIAVLLALAVAAALPLLHRLTGLLASDWDVHGIVLLAALACGLALLVRLESKLGRILALTAVGFAVALLYGLLDAPDLVLTQLLVEVLTTVFFVLAVRFIGHREPPPLPSRTLRSLRLAFAATVGLAFAALAVALHSLPTQTRIPDYYFEAGPAVAKGHNLVNLVLSDFRGIDTLIETLVVLIVGLGVIALLGGRELSPGPGSSEAER
jgi:NADH:ubiquinone oxidoreductase subunit 5 (subunit L)/multisubunit Na+/H+ antiporter MnhA subunit